MPNLNIKSKVSLDDSAEDIFSKLLNSRGYNTVAKQAAFLKSPSPDLQYLLKELSISKKDLQSAADIINKHIKQNNPICIYGDYDADGVTATAILWKTLIYLGAKVMPYIPHRKKHGYGMSRNSLDEIISGDAFSDTPMHPFRPSLLITVDNGIVSHSQIKYLKEKSLEVILTDHHQKESKIPPADAIIHSNLTSGAGIAWVLSLFLTNQHAHTRSLIDLATIGIVADQMPLTGVNRAIVARGLKALTATSNPGLIKLYQITNIDNKQLSTYDINFVIAPRINAMGRLDHAIEALRLLCANNPRQAQELATTLDSTNKKRQDITYQALLQTTDFPKNNKIVVVSSPEFHEGVIGLIASKLAEETRKPSIVISVGSQTSKGSARSIKGINITNLLKETKELLTKIGGHTMAAGFSLKTKDLEKFTNTITALANKEIDEAALSPTISIDAKLTLKQNSKKLFHLIKTMEPFGLGNPKPKFISKPFTVLTSKYMGQDNQHAKLTIEQNGTTQELVWFNLDKRINLSNISECTYTLDLNVWNGKENIQLILKHAK